MARKAVLLYHSVASPEHPGVLGSFPIPMARFVRQIEAARRQGWCFGRLSEIRRPTADKTLYITGDDGTVDWARNVLPYCEREGIPTHTAVITGPWLDRPVYPIAHRVQILLARPDLAPPCPPLTPEQMAYVDRVYAYETDRLRRHLKGACNLCLDDDAAQRVLGLPRFAEQVLLAERFARPEDYARFSLAEFGVHTVAHRAFGGDPERYVGDQIAPCLAALLRHGLRVSRYFTLPMQPRFGATMAQLVGPLRDYGFEGILDSQGEWDGDGFVVGRIDAKQVENRLELPPWTEDAPQPQRPADPLRQ